MIPPLLIPPLPWHSFNHMLFCPLFPRSYFCLYDVYSIFLHVCCSILIRQSQRSEVTIFLHILISLLSCHSYNHASHGQNIAPPNNMQILCRFLEGNCHPHDIGARAKTPNPNVLMSNAKYIRADNQIPTSTLQPFLYNIAFLNSISAEDWCEFLLGWCMGWSNKSWGQAALAGLIWGKSSQRKKSTRGPMQDLKSVLIWRKIESVLQDSTLLIITYCKSLFLLSFFLC